ncbi:luciferin sulfotransferase-like [Drosophila bipectinata]|uniref:luciferin sulfotransferase-like n=1 Tax=Drosophila bipectinata TaxID=42026 RepID=UPI0038B29FC6
MYISRPIESSATRSMVQVQCQGLNGAGPSWVPLKQDWSQRWCTLSGLYTADYAERVGGFQTRDSDVFLVSFMKCGTTWLQELSWLLLNQLDFEQSSKSYIMQRSPYLEYSSNSPLIKMDSIKICDDLQSTPRLIKSHLPAQLLPREIWEKRRKIIYVARNPKDVVVSSYHFLTGTGYWRGNMDEYVDQFVAGRIFLTSFWSHVIDFYRMRSEENIFFVTYEKMKEDLENVIRRLSAFLESPDLSQTEMKNLLEYLSFENMKASTYGNPTARIKSTLQVSDDFEFMRRGIVGSYKDELNFDQKRKIDNWTRCCLEEYGLTEFDIFGNV